MQYGNTFMPLARPILFALLLSYLSVHAADKEEKVKFPLPNPSAIGSEKFSALLNRFLDQGGYQKWKQDLRPRWTGPYFVHPSGVIESFGTHGASAVKVYYSEQVWKWMNSGRKGQIADGGMIVKVLYARNPEDPTRYSEDPTGFSIMVKDSKGSWDGWFYSDGGPLQKPTHEHAAKFFDPNAGFALSCINCHATTDNPESTYSSLRNVTDAPIEHLTTVSPEGLKKGLERADDIHSIHDKAALAERRDRMPSPYLKPLAKDLAQHELRPLPQSMLDHVPQGPRPDGHRRFITSSNCQACHDAVQLYSVLPNMAVKEEPSPGQTSLVNLSPNSEWRYSMMGLSGRDPVFFAQLESERVLHPELADQIDNKCLSCHGVMGQRQFKIDRGPDALFTHQHAQALPGSVDEKYGALARDGVSCVICHQMSPDGMGQPSTYTGKFKLDENVKQVYGPYEKTVVLPMEQAIGLTPKHGAHLADSKLCASCHTVVLPVLDVGKKYSPEEFSKLAENPPPESSAHEQATYLEWQNSSYTTESAPPGPLKQSCQDCHMPRTYNGKPLKFKIANIEDDTFPIVDHRAANDQLHMDVRDRFSRHALHGINIFMLEMFRQNPVQLGISPKDNLFPGPEVKSGFDVAIQSALKMAREETATIKILKVKREGNRLRAEVEVKNLAGHKFPTGVNFRRAFIEFKVQAGDKTIWASGQTDEWGVIGTLRDGKFAALSTEFFNDKQYQPHHQKIEREDQVQIYEDLATDSAGNFTTSFLSLKNVVKDNRLQPHGWKNNAAGAENIESKGTAADPDYNSGEGRDVIVYDIPLDAAGKGPLNVSATLYFQSLPPYYLQRLTANSDKQAAQTLLQLLSQLDLANTPVRDWKLKISQDGKVVE
jgi:hypothetical protein